MPIRPKQDLPVFSPPLVQLGITPSVVISRQMQVAVFGERIDWVV